MPRQTRETIGDVIVFDGSNAHEIAEALGLDTPLQMESGALTLNVPLPLGGSVDTRLALGDGLVSREPHGFLPIPADQLDQFPEVRAKATRKAAEKA